MPALLLSPEILEIDKFARRFEAAHRADQSVRLEQYLPAANDPHFSAVLCELVRIELEIGWSKGKPRSVQDYCGKFPCLLDNPELLGAVVYEEYRQRCDHGESPDAAEYGRLYGVNTAAWPNGNEVLTTSMMPPPVDFDRRNCSTVDCNFSNQGTDAADLDGAGLEDAAKAFLEFSRTNIGIDDEAYRSHCASLNVPPEAANLFCDVHHSNPKAAERLAKAAVCFPQVGSDYLGFRLIDELGRGAFARVYVAQQKDLANRYVALKVSTDLFGEPQRLAQLQHTHIVPIYSIHQVAPFQAICMPCLGSTTLADLLKNLHGTKSLPVSGKHFVTTLNDRKRNTILATDSERAGQHGRPSSADFTLPCGQMAVLAETPTPVFDTLEGLTYVRAVLWFGDRLAQGLAHAHQRGILHRDLKPANILLTDEGQPMLLDFNLSEDTKLRSVAAVAAMGGTLPYMSPEQLAVFHGEKKAVDARTDIYSLGLILFELLTGRMAYPLRQGRVSEILPKMIEDRKQTPPRLRCHNKQITPAVESIIRHCLEPDPDRRYRSAKELQEDLERQLSDLPLKHAAEPSVKERVLKWSRRHPRMASSTTIGILAILLISMSPLVLAIRQHHMHQLEAQDNLNGFREDVRMAEFLLNKQGPESKQNEEGIRQCQQALQRYQVLENPSWFEQALVRDLPPTSDLQGLRQDVAEVLLLWARASYLDAQKEKDQARRQEKAAAGLRLVDLAAGQGEARHTSKAVLLARADLTRLQQGRTGEANRLLADAEKLEPQTALDFFLVAMRHCDQKEFPKAVELLQESTRRQPQQAWAWFYQGYCYQELGQYREAVSCYTACIPLFPAGYTQYLPIYNRGLAFTRLGKFALACADFDEASRLRPQATDVFINRGIANRAWGKYPAAIKDFSHALELDPTITRIYFLRAKALAKTGDTEAAKRDVAKGMQEEPTDEAGYIERGIARLPKDTTKALEDFDKALELNSRSMLALQNKAYVLADLLQDPKAAVEVLNKAVALYPGFTRARVGRGVVLARLGRREEAVADARQALSQDSSPETFYQVANVYALTSTDNPDDKVQAIQLLSNALHNGFGHDIVDKDPDLDPIRNCKEFVQLMQTVREWQKTTNTNKF